jgi:putative ABC transport system permease protein
MRPTPPWPWLSVVARTSLEPSTLARTVTLAVAAADPDVPISATKTLDEVRGESVAQPRVYTLLLGVFAGLALALAAVGLYGVMAYTVTQRIPEIGIRLALGADRRAVLGLVLKQAVFLVVVGVVVGLAATVPAAGVLTSLTPAARPNDPATLACVSILLLTVALLASYLPARRASRVDPTVALKQE